jgi:hypothetical protein
MKKNNKANILDLTLREVRFELAISDEDLIGEKGACFLEELKSKAIEVNYTHIYYRDAFRPGIIWFEELNFDRNSLPVRSKLEWSKKICNKVFPGFLNVLKKQKYPNVLNAKIPQAQVGVSVYDLVTALEYVVFCYPELIRALISLNFIYQEYFNLESINLNELQESQKIVVSDKRFLLS